MKVEICNLGVIKNAAIDLKPLTVFIGDNSAGKTWVAYALAAIFGQFGYEKYQTAYLDGQVELVYSPIENAIKQLLNDGNAQIDLVQFANEYAQIYMNDVARLASRWMPTFIATQQVTFDNLQIHLKLAETKTTLLDNIIATTIDSKLSFSSQSKQALLNALKESGKPTLYFFSTFEGQVLDKLPHRAVTQFVSTQSDTP